MCLYIFWIFRYNFVFIVGVVFVCVCLCFYAWQYNLKLTLQHGRKIGKQKDRQIIISFLFCIFHILNKICLGWFMICNWRLLTFILGFLLWSPIFLFEDNFVWQNCNCRGSVRFYIIFHIAKTAHWFIAESSTTTFINSVDNNVKVFPDRGQMLAGKLSPTKLFSLQQFMCKAQLNFDIFLQVNTSIIQKKFHRRSIRKTAPF